MKRHRFPSQLFAVGLALLFIALLLAPVVWRAATPKTPEAQVQEAWQLAQRVGTYEFQAAIDQRTYPAPSLSNVGRSSRHEQIYLEGQLDRPAELMELMIWQEGGEVTTKQGATEIRMERNESFGRVAGGEWEPLDNVENAFAPGNDMTAYLAGIKNVAFVGTETLTLPAVGDTTYSRYTFTIDGPAFAAHARKQLEQQLRQRGDLPAGLQTDLTRQYTEMTGTGEVWLDEYGLPLRLILNQSYPPNELGEQVEAQIHIDFKHFDLALLAELTTPMAGFMAAVGLPQTASGWQQLSLQLSLALLVTGVMAGVATHHRSRKLYMLITILVIGSMQAAPLLHAEEVSSFAERQQERQAQAEADRAAQQEPAAAPSIAPHTDPMVAATQQTAQSMNQQAELHSILGLPTNTGFAVPTDPTLDTDADGLTDVLEVRLGTLYDDVDTDGDWITDTLEVKGFTFNSQIWYSDPRSIDTNEDGRLDSMECTTTGSGSSLALSCPDSDGDLIPNLWDTDDDGDGVPDSLDLSPSSVFPGNPAQVAGYTRQQPFALKLQGVAADKPILVNFELRPKNPEQLWYTMNVLDWPYDSEGQIQHVLTSTLATGRTPEQIAGDKHSPNGDLRLVPMLELKLSGNLPLPLTTPSTTISLGGTFSGTLTMQQQGADISFKLTYSTPISQLDLYPGTRCEGTSLFTWNNPTSGGSTTKANDNLTSVANGAHTIKLTGNGQSACYQLRDIPNGQYTSEMVDVEQMARHGVTVLDMGDGTTVRALVPLVLKQDNAGQNAAFAGQMFYDSNATAWPTQNARFTWAVQMISDECIGEPNLSAEAQKNDAKKAEEIGHYCAKSENRREFMSVIHTYYEEWYLTGLLVEELHGASVAVVFEKPTTDTNLFQDTELWKLANGLEQSFLTARDDNNNGVRDITVQEIQNRWNNSGTTYTDSQRWGIAANKLHVQRYQFDKSTDLAQIPMIETKALLAQYFTSYATSNPTLAPTFLFAQEQKVRSASLDLGGSIASYTSGSRQLTMDLSSSTLAQMTSAALSWAPYRYVNGVWDDYPLMDYVGHLEIQLAAIFMASVPPNDVVEQEVALGRAVAAKLYYQALAMGVGMIVQQGTYLHHSGPSANDTTLQTQAPTIFTTVTDKLAMAFGNILKTVMRYSLGIGLPTLGDIIKDFIAKDKKAIAENPNAFQLLSTLPLSKQILIALRVQPFINAYRAAIADEGHLKAVLSVNKFKDMELNGPERYHGNLSGKAWGRLYRAVSIVGLIAIVAAAVLTITAIIATIANPKYEENLKSDPGIVVKIIGAGVNAFFAISGLLAGIEVATQLATVGWMNGNVGDLAYTSATSFVRTIRITALVAAVIDLVFTWSFFFAQLAMNGGANTPWQVTRQMLASAIASTVITAIILAVMLAIPVIGIVIVTIYGAIGALATLTCMAIEAAGVKLNDVGLAYWSKKAGCGFIIGLLAEFLTQLVNSGDFVGNMKDEHRLKIGEINQALNDQELGLTAGNSFTVSTSIVSSLGLNWDSPQLALSGYVRANPDSMATLKSTILAYRLANTSSGLTNQEVINDPGLMAWTQIGADNTQGMRLQKVVPLGLNRTIPAAGINTRIPLYLKEYSDLPYRNCFFGDCKIERYTGTTAFNLWSAYVFDILPSSVDGLVEMLANPAASAGHSAPAQKDADGDYLLSAAANGPDPDDRTPDTDGDMLSDYDEIRLGSNPTDPDSDNDTLSDYEEVLAGTKPTAADTDADGLLDGEEVPHRTSSNTLAGGWLFVYGRSSGGSNLNTLVWSNPLEADTDGDALSDYQEKLYGSNPVVAEHVTPMALLSSVREVKAPTLLFSFEEAEGATNFRDRAGEGYVATCTGSACPTAGQPGRFGAAAAFDGNDKLATTTGGVEFGKGSFTIATWIKTTGTNQSIMVKGDGDTSWDVGEKNFYLDWQGHPSFVGWGNDYLWSTVAVNNGQWHHVAVTWSYSGGTSGTGKIYVDGVDATATNSNHAANHADNAADTITIGQSAYNNVGGNSLSGVLDELVVFDRALTAGEIPALRDGRYDLNDGVTQPGSTLAYESQLSNYLPHRTTSGWLHTVLAPVYNAFTNFVMQPSEVVTLTGNLAAPQATGPVSFTQVAGAEITDLHAASNYAALWLPFEGATPLTDNSGLNQSVSCTSCPTSGVAGMPGTALSFDGTNDHLLMSGNVINLGRSSYTISAWVKTTASNQAIVSKTDNDTTWEPGEKVFYLSGGSPAFVGWGNNYVWTDVTVNDGKWHHVAVTWNTGSGTSGTAKIYVDRKDVTNPSSNYAANYEDNAADSVYIGRPNYGSGEAPNYFSGTLDDVRIYPRALSANEMARFEHGLVFSSAFESYSVAGFIDDTAYGHSITTTCNSSPLPECPSTSTGLHGNAPSFYFSGFDNSRLLRVAANPALDLNRGDGHFSIALWMNSDQSEPGHILGNEEPNTSGTIGFPSIRHQGTTIRAQFGTGSNACMLVANVPAQFRDSNGDWMGGWHHLVLSFDGTFLRLHLDRGELGAQNCAGKKPSATNAFYIGHWKDARSSQAFKGLLDNLEIYNYALSAEELEHNYWATRPALVLRFDDLPGTTAFADSSERGYTGSCNKTNDECPITGLPGRWNQAAKFDGSNDLVQISPAPNLANSSFSVAFWAKRTNINSTGWVVGQGTPGSTNNSLHVGFRSNNVFACGFWFNDLNTSATYTEQDWHHWTCTYDAKDKKRTIYRDSVQVAQDTASAHYQGSGTINIGQFNNERFQGTVDDLQIMQHTLTVTEVRKLYRQSPLVALHFEEPYNSTQFVDDGGDSWSRVWSCMGSCPTAGIGIKGRVGLAVEFDGTDALKINYHRSVNSTPELTMSTWVNLKDPNANQKILGNTSIGNGYLLGVISSKLFPEIWDTTGTRYTFEAGTIPADSWTHLAVTWKSGGQMIGYINGAEVKRINASANNVAVTTSNEYIGAAPWNGTDYPVRGRIDEVAIWERSLTGTEVREIYEQQAGWVSDTYAYDMLVDNDLPTSDVLAPPTYLANRDVQLAVQAADPTSSVAMVELGVQAPGAGGYSWSYARSCQDSLGTTWCPTFKPTTGEGRYYLQTRAVDSVAHLQSALTTVTAYVDGTPPTITSSIANNTLLSATLNSQPSAGRLVQLSGTVSDPQISGGFTGSGVAPASVWVTLYASDGIMVSSGRQQASVTGSAWSIAYQLPDGDPTGAYTVKVEASDTVGNQRTEPALLTIRIDSSAPRAKLNATAIPTTTTTLTGSSSLSGSVAELNVPAGTQLHLRFDEGTGATSFADSSPNAATAACGGTGCPSSGGAGQVGNAAGFNTSHYLSVPHAASLNPGTELTMAAWVKLSTPGYNQKIVGKTPIGSGYLLGVGSSKLYPEIWDSTGQNYSFQAGSIPANTWTHVAVTWKSGGQMIAYINGMQVHSINASTNPIGTNTNPLYLGAAPWNVNSLRINGGSLDEVMVATRELSAHEIRLLANIQSSGITSAAVSFQPMGQSAALVNEIPPANQVLHLPFEEQPTSSGTTSFADLSATNLTATCSSNTCPSVGVAGRYGSALNFDGTNDYVELAGSFSLPTFTQAVWVYPTSTDSDYRGIFGYHGSSNETRAPSIYLYQQTRVHAGFGDGTTWNYFDTPSGVVTPNAWNHIATTFDGTTYRIYVNGSLAASTTTMAGKVPYTVNTLRIGLVDRYFQGRIDEAMLFNRALSAAELRTLFLGAGPLLALPFDQPISAGGTSQSDTSGMERTALLTTGTSDQINKAVTGKVGSGALAFDGIDDYVEVTKTPDLQLTSGTISTWFRADAGVNAGAILADEKLNGSQVKWSYRLSLGAPTGTLTFDFTVNNRSGSYTFTGPAVNDNQWHHVAIVRDDTAKTVKLYLDGVLVTSGNYSGTIDNTNNPLWIGRSPYNGGSYAFKGRVDDVRLYGRMLSALEISELYTRTWQGAALAQSGTGVASTTWSASPPTGLEGFYTLNLRATDTLGNTDRSGMGGAVWGGMVDTLAPRLSVSRTYNGTNTTYTVIAEDFNLNQTSLSLGTACTLSITDLQYYQSTWYKTVGGSQRPFKATASCTIAGNHTATVTASVTDTAGNATQANP